MLDHDFPDPDVLLVEDTYYAYATNSGNVNIQVARSTDLVNWELLPTDALPALPDWAVQEFGWAWAPDVQQVDDDTFLMYHVARFAIDRGGTQCIGAAISDSPEGPFEPVGDEPLICQVTEGGSIDPASFVDEDGTRYVLWKNDGNSTGGTSWLYIQPTSNDGLTLEGEPTRLIRADKAWEGVLVEAPTLWHRNDRYFLFYSANAYTSPNYAVGFAVSPNLLGPYTKPNDPLLATSIRAGVVGPGGQDIVLDGDGDTWIVYHEWEPESIRSLNLIALMWEAGRPVVEPSRDPRRAP